MHLSNGDKSLPACCYHSVKGWTDIFVYTILMGNDEQNVFTIHNEN
jgi:hypothetical protein